MSKQTLFGSGAVALGIAATSLLAPQGVQAAVPIAFTFSFGGVEGLIEGLVEGFNPCDGTDSCTVSVTNPGLTDAVTGIYPNAPFVTGFTVAGTSLASGGWAGINGTSTLCFSRSVGSTLADCGVVGDDGVSILRNMNSGQSVIDVPTFQRIPDAVPGPVPLMGAVAAFGYSRRLRKRIKGS